MPRFAAINLRHLEGIAALCRTHSFGTAAREINITQSALTQAVASIERRLNLELFERSPRGAKPTPAGEKLAETIRRAVDRLNAAASDVLPADFRQVPLTRRSSVTQLLALTAVERAGSFRRGARDSGLSEASLHRAVRALEAALGTELIVRTKTGVKATPAAVAISQATRQAMAELQTCFATIQAGLVTTLIIGATPTLRCGPLADAIAEFLTRQEGVHFRIEGAPRPELILGLLDGKFDMVLCPFNTKPPEGVLQYYVFDERLEIVARSDHPLHSQNGDFTIKQLAGYPWIVNPPNTPRRGIWESLFRAQDVEPPLPWMECKSSEVMRELLLKTDALAMLSSDQIRIERETGVLTPITGKFVPAHTRKVVIATRATWIPDATESLLIDTLRRCGSRRTTLAKKSAKDSSAA